LRGGTSDITARGQLRVIRLGRRPALELVLTLKEVDRDTKTADGARNAGAAIDKMGTKGTSDVSNLTV
jgi:hypothetical protein